MAIASPRLDGKMGTVSPLPPHTYNLKVGERCSKELAPWAQKGTSRSVVCSRLMTGYRQLLSLGSTSDLGWYQMPASSA